MGKTVQPPDVRMKRIIDHAKENITAAFDRFYDLMNDINYLGRNDAPLPKLDNDGIVIEFYHNPLDITIEVPKPGRAIMVKANSHPIFPKIEIWTPYDRVAAALIRHITGAGKPLERFLDMIRVERQAQRPRWGAEDEERGLSAWFNVLTHQIVQLDKAIKSYNDYPNSEEHVKAWRTELLHTAAVAVAMYEHVGFDRINSDQHNDEKPTYNETE